MKLRLFTPALTILLFAACVGTHFDWDDARQIHVGMTESEVIQKMGKPYTMSAADGNEYWTWNYGTGLGTGGYFRIVMKAGRVSEVPAIPRGL